MILSLAELPTSLVSVCGGRGCFFYSVITDKRTYSEILSITPYFHSPTVDHAMFGLFGDQEDILAESGSVIHRLFFSSEVNTCSDSVGMCTPY